MFLLLNKVCCITLVCSSRNDYEHYSEFVLSLSDPAGVGDGGNELGMGKLKDKVEELMPNGGLIACVVPADYAITAGVDLQLITLKVNAADYSAAVVMAA